jgi:hypothetical protein
MTGRRKLEPIRFWRGSRLYQIAHIHDGDGFMGLCEGRVIATAPDRAAVMRAILMTARWAA